MNERVDDTGAEIIEWYLPSVVEAQSLKETGTGNETTPISPLDGTYWSSTASSDPSSEDNITNGYAYSYSYTYSANTYIYCEAVWVYYNELTLIAV